ncbi:uncharacterized protein LOC106137707 isoform X2 [Amyelois transitella]|uniref:uncharacterized protein LOC106137707 isoform X2 n=1 Tax=Amyelois transitella TaxID=680683 RepID=UPI00298FDABB|nr:uncharacterized protein LOC106137707 isoform X2 [Amyelois transitella]
MGTESVFQMSSRKITFLTMESEGSTYKNPGNQQTVTSVGNAWVVSRSKSYPGRIYYFNTLTGEAVWNLSSEEIEKVKKRTAKLPLQPGNFPEPQEPPADHSNDNPSPVKAQQPTITQYGPPNVFNKQIINNQFSRPSCSSYVASCRNCTSINPVENMVGVRPNVWIQPPQIFLATPSPSISNINQSLEKSFHHNSYSQDFPIQNTSVSLSKRFTFANRRQKNCPKHPHAVGKFMPKGIKFKNRKPFVHKMQQQHIVSDLRAIIKAKKSENDNVHTKGGQQNNLNKVQESVNHDLQTSVLMENKLSSSSPVENKLQTSTPAENKTIVGDLHSNTDDEWLKNNGTIEGAKLKLDVTILRNLATENTDCECWYIVVDRNVLMRHFNFLNVLTNSDDQCKLMIVRDVMTELQAAARSDAAKEGARKVLRGLSQLFAAKLAVIAEYSFKPNELKNCIGMINFCSMLQQQNEHVVLLCNEEALQKHSSKIPTFTIQEVKDLLTSDKFKESKVDPLVERNIKITIPNDVQSYDDNSFFDEMETTANISVQEHFSNTLTSETDKKETDVQTDNIIPIAKKMVDAEVQTETSSEFPLRTSQKDSIGVNTVEVNYVDRETNAADDSLVVCDRHATSIKKTREIRLKRSMSNQTLRSNNCFENKHFKWLRKKRDSSVTFSDSSLSCDDRLSRMSGTSFDQHIANVQDAICQPRSQSMHMHYEDYAEGSESSSCVYMLRDKCENILIEETSTSDVISNSVSNVDSESMQELNKAKEKSNSINDEVQSKNVMFEITSKDMEQNLKMRRDEWLAEFNQIMEEVLTQILRGKSEYVMKNMPPPWTLHEATECIKKIFIGDRDVFDAATKLSQVIHKMSDTKGKIIMNFNPNEFMELYSYGVYLIDSLQSILEKSEDLQVAAESLAKLLSDIERPIGEPSQNDSFGEPTEVSVIVSQTSAEAAVAAPNQENHSVSSNKTNSSRRNQKGIDTESSQSSGKYNLRSGSKPQHRKPGEDNGETPSVKFIRKVNIPDDFFTSLQLQKKDGTADDNAQEIKNSGQLVLNNNKTNSPEKPTATVPNIIRNFTKCPELEARLNKNSREPLDMDMLDYSMGYNDFESDDIEETYSDDYSQNQDHITEEWKDDFPEENELAAKSHADNNNNNFEILVGSLMEEIRQTTVKVHEFCKKAHDEMLSGNMQTNRRNEIIDRAQKANAHIQNMSNSFRRIQDGYMNQNGDGFRSRLREAGILMNDKEELVYRNVIGSCIEQGDTLLESITTVIDAIKA